MPANVVDKVLITDPKTLQERQKVARDFAAQFKVSVPILVDTIDDQIEKAYAAWPDRFYVIDAEGKIAYKGGVGPAGFKVADVPPVLDRLLGAPAGPNAAVPPTPAPAAGAPTTRERLLTMLGRLGVAEKDTEQVIQATERKSAAYQDVMHARRLLIVAAQTGDLTRALADFQDVQKSYRQTSAKLDRELDAAIGYSKKPALFAVLTAMGVVGDAPAPPFSGLPGTGDRPAGAGGAVFPRPAQP
jgi:hypothetical protein